MEESPFSVKPEILYERDRIIELNRAIFDHVNIYLQIDSLPKWAEELKRRIDRYMKIQKNRPE